MSHRLQGEAVMVKADKLKEQRENWIGIQGFLSLERWILSIFIQQGLNQPKTNQENLSITHFPPFSQVLQ